MTLNSVNSVECICYKGVLARDLVTRLGPPYPYSLDTFFKPPTFHYCILIYDVTSETSLPGVLFNSYIKEIRIPIHRQTCFWLITAFTSAVWDDQVETPANADIKDCCWKVRQGMSNHHWATNYSIYLQMVCIVIS